MHSEDPKKSSDEDASGQEPQLPPVADDSEIAPIEAEASGDQESAVTLPAGEGQEDQPDPLVPAGPADGPPPEVVADARSDDRFASDGEPDPGLPENAPASTIAESSPPDESPTNDLPGQPEATDAPLDVQIELPGDAPVITSGSTMAATSAEDAAPSPSADLAPAPEQDAFVSDDAAPVAESPPDPSFAGEESTNAMTPSSDVELSPPVFAERGTPQGHFSSFDSQPTGDQLLESPSFEPLAAQPTAASESPDGAESFRMPPLLLEVSRTDWEQRMEQLIERFATRVDQLVEERIEDKLSYRDHVQAAQMRALYWRG